MPLPRAAAAATLTTAAFAGTLALAPAAPAPGGRPPAARAPAAAEQTPAVVAYSWPLAPAPRVLRAMDVLDSPYAPGHRGVDLAAGPGTEVLAAGSGTVAFAGPVAGRGVVTVAHPDGLHTTYEPLTPAVTAGTAVRAGQVLGTLAVQPPHCPVGSCLHWGARRGTQYLDPLALLRPVAPPVLLPVTRGG